MSAAPGDEAALCVAYREAGSLYEAALDLACRLPEAFRRGTSADDALQRLMGLLAGVRQIDETTATARAAWHTSRRAPGPELAAELARVTTLLERLTVAVDEAQREAAAQQARLAPQLDGLARGRQMQRAYSAPASGERGASAP